MNTKSSTYQVSSILTIMLIIFSGCLSHDEDGGKPNAHISVDKNEPRIEEEIAFSGNMSESIDGNILEFYWDFGDGEELSTTEPTANHSYEVPGFYNVTLVVTDKSGSSNPDNTTIKVRPLDWYSNRSVDHLIIGPYQQSETNDDIPVEIHSKIMSVNISAENHVGSEVTYNLTLRDPTGNISSEIEFDVSQSSRHMRARYYYNLTLYGDYDLRIQITNNGNDPADTTYQLYLKSLY